MKSKYNSDPNHTIYYNKYGEEVPSATTILKILNKPQLVKWANYLGFKNLDVDSVLNEASTLGTAVHEIINKILSKYYIIYINDGKVPLEVLYSYINTFKVWLNTNDVEPIFLEKKIVSDKVGGTIDFYGNINNKRTLLDFKSSKKIRISMFFQLAIYCMMLEELGYQVDQVGILLVNPKVTRNNEKYIQREDFQPYIDFVKGLIDLFHSYSAINNLDKWNENII